MAQARSGAGRRYRHPAAGENRLCSGGSFRSRSSPHNAAIPMISVLIKRLPSRFTYQYPDPGTSMLNNPASSGFFLSMVSSFSGRLDAGRRLPGSISQWMMKKINHLLIASQEIGLLQGFPAFFEQAVDLQDGLCARDALHECPLLAEHASRTAW